jgi:hypothetical protein
LLEVEPPAPLPPLEASARRRTRFAFGLAISCLLVATALVCLAVVGGIAYLRSANPDGVVLLSKAPLHAAQVIEVSPGSAWLTVPRGWSGTTGRYLVLPAWLGFSRPLVTANTRGAFASPTSSSDHRAVFIDYDFNRPDWSEVSAPKPTTAQVVLDRNLRRLGVRTAIVRASTAASGGVDVWLFVDLKPDRLLIQLTMPATKGGLPSAQQVAEALHAAGVTIKPQ